MKIDPRKMQRMLKQMGVNVEELKDVESVIIKTKEKELNVENPQVVIMEYTGQRTLQISGNITERKILKISNEDIKLVAEQAKVTEEQAKKALEQTSGDLAAAILLLHKNIKNIRFQNQSL